MGELSASTPEAASYGRSPLRLWLSRLLGPGVRVVDARDFPRWHVACVMPDASGVACAVQRLSTPSADPGRWVARAACESGRFIDVLFADAAFAYLLAWLGGLVEERGTATPRPLSRDARAPVEGLRATLRIERRAHTYDRLLAQEYPGRWGSPIDHLARILSDHVGLASEYEACVDPEGTLGQSLGIPGQRLFDCDLFDANEATQVRALLARLEWLVDVCGVQVAEPVGRADVRRRGRQQALASSLAMEVARRADTWYATTPLLRGSRAMLALRRLALHGSAWGVRLALSLSDISHSG